jgi:uncharacterized protein (TIRG00374 family)
MGISLLSLLVIFFFIDPREIFTALLSVHLGYLGLTALGILAFMLIRAVRWRFMLDNAIPWRQVFHIQNIGYMFNMVLPLRLGDVARGLLIGNVPPVTLAAGISTMVVERVLDLMIIVALLPFTLVQVAEMPEWMRIGAQTSGVAAISVLVVLVLAANQRGLARRVSTAVFNRIPFMETAPWVKRVDDLLGGLRNLTSLSDSLILLLLSILVWVPIVFAYQAGLIAAGISATPLQAGFVVCAAAFSITIPSSPGQIGVFHAGVIAALQIMGEPEAASASFAFAYHALNVLLMIILGTIGLLGTGSTFGSVVAATRNFVGRQQETEFEEV